MSIYINKQTKVIVQGITGSQGQFHTKLMSEYGTNIVAGVTPGKGGQKVDDIPVLNTVKEAVQEYSPQWSVIFVPAALVKDAALEALEYDLNIVLITEGVPVHDSLDIVAKAQEKNLVVIGPNCPGLISVGEAKLGIIPGHIFQKGNVGLVSRSGTLTYEIVDFLRQADMGITTAVGIGGDPIIGTHFIDVIKEFDQDPETEKIVLVGEIGGNMEEKAAEYIKVQGISKPVVAYITGQTAPKGKTMGHAGAIISGKSSTAQYKMDALEKLGVPVAKLPSEVAEMLK